MLFEINIETESVEKHFTFHINGVSVLQFKFPCLFFQYFYCYSSDTNPKLKCYHACFTGPVGLMSLCTLNNFQYKSFRDVTLLYLGHPLKKSCFWSSGRVGFLADWELFFFLNYFYILPTKKKRRGKNCGRLNGHNFGHPLDRKPLFFKSGLSVTLR